MTEELLHQPVLLREVAQFLAPGATPAERPRRLIDGTLGNGGHAARLLADDPAARLIGIDRDRAALERARRTLAFAADRVTLVHGEYADMARIADEAGWGEVDGILLDIGISSPQIDTAERGFSWRMDGPLDMRMDRESPVTASRLLNRADERELERIFREYGEIRQARRLANRMVLRRESAPFATTGELAAFCDEVLGRSRPGQLPSPTLVFQALRIAVNDELGQLERGLAAAESLLAVGGILAVITFHSLEDRMVKNYIRDAARSCICPPGLPVCCCGKTATMTPVNRQVVTASPEELAVNRRAASAKLRAAQKIAVAPQPQQQAGRNTPL